MARRFSIGSMKAQLSRLKRSVSSMRKRKSKRKGRRRGRKSAAIGMPAMIGIAVAAYLLLSGKKKY